MTCYWPYGPNLSNGQYVIPEPEPRTSRISDIHVFDPTTQQLIAYAATGTLSFNPLDARETIYSSNAQVYQTIGRQTFSPDLPVMPVTKMNVTVSYMLGNQSRTASANLDLPITTGQRYISLTLKGGPLTPLPGPGF